jgi:hypothetical protein
MVVRRHGVVAALVALILVASCSLPRPAVGLSIAGTSVTPSREGSYCQHSGCSGACGDTAAPVAPLTTVRASPPIRLDFSPEGEVTEIHVQIWQGERSSGQPIESFGLPGRQPSRTSTAMTAGRYYLAVSIEWSRAFDRGDTSRAFLVEIVPP